MKSYWEESIHKKEYPRLQEDTSTDVCIIGGGMVGVLTAYMLKESGYQVTIVEKDNMCMGVTANTTAKLTSQHDLFYNYLITNFNKEYAAGYLKANEQAIELAKNIIKKEDIQCDFEVQDSYVFTNQESEIKRIKEEVEALQLLGFEAEFTTNTTLPFPILRCSKV